MNRYVLLHAREQMDWLRVCRCIVMDDSKAMHAEEQRVDELMLNRSERIVAAVATKKSSICLHNNMTDPVCF